MKLNKPAMYIFIILLVAGVCLIPKLNALYFFALLIAAVIFIIYKRAERQDRKFLITLVFVIFLTRFLLSIAVMSARSAELSQDEGLYSKKALMMAYDIKGEHNLERYFFEFFNGDSDMLQRDYGFNIYTRMAGVFYYVFGYQVQALRFINIFLGILSFLLVFYLGKRLFDRNAARLASVIFAFFPSIILWSVAIGTDTLIIFCNLLFMYSAVSMAKKFSLRALFIMTGAILTVNTIRPHISIILVVLGTTSLAVILIRKLGKIQKMIGLAAVIVTIIFLVNSPIALVMKGNLQDILRQFIVAQGSFAFTDDSGYTVYPLQCYKGLTVTRVEFITGYCNGMRYALFAPFPWKIESRLQLLAYPQVVVWYFMFPFLIIGAWHALRKDAASNWVVVAYSVAVFSFLALVEGNIGALFRHRDMVTPFLIIYFAIGVEWIRQKYFT